MPTYTFFNEESGMEWDDIMSVSEKEKFLKNNSHIKQVISSMNIVSGVGGIKNDGGWNEVMDRVSDANPNSTFAASRGSRQTSKEVKTRQVVEKWRKQRAKSGDSAKL